MHTTNYTDTFILVAEDCPVSSGTEPPLRNGMPTLATRQFQLMIEHPYGYTSDQLLFQIYSDRIDLPESEWEEARKSFFSRGQPCLRASPLSKRYGWGIHSDTGSYIALYGMETDLYARYAKNKEMQCLKAMRNSRK